MDDLDKQEEIDALERQRIQRRRERMTAMRRKKRQQELFRSWALVAAAGMAVLALTIWGLVRLVTGPKLPGTPGTPDSPASQAQMKAGQDLVSRSRYSPAETPYAETDVAQGRFKDASGSEELPGMGHAPGSGELPGMGDASGSGKLPGAGDASGSGKLPGAGDASGCGELPGGGDAQDTQEPETGALIPQGTVRTVGFPEEGRGVYSTNGVLIDAQSGEVLAARDASQRINPASMTKILTLLVAAEHAEDLQDQFVMTVEITDYTYRHDCSIAGYGVGQSVTVEELMYGTILPSGAEAAMALAEYTAGSQEAFVELMNQKLEQLGLSDTAHFTNCVGLYDEEHYCTVYDMAVILKAAADNELCRRVLSARTFATSVPSEQQPDGILLSNWFLRRIEDKDTHGEVLCAKTGFVNQSGSCAASLAADHEGREYICVTTGSMSSWTCIYDHVELYQAFLK